MDNKKIMDNKNVFKIKQSDEGFPLLDDAEMLSMFKMIYFNEPNFIKPENAIRQVVSDLRKLGVNREYKVEDLESVRSGKYDKYQARSVLDDIKMIMDGEEVTLDPLNEENDRKLEIFVKRNAPMMEYTGEFKIKIVSKR